MDTFYINYTFDNVLWQLHGTVSKIRGSALKIKRNILVTEILFRCINNKRVLSTCFWEGDWHVSNTHLF